MPKFFTAEEAKAVSFDPCAQPGVTYTEALLGAAPDNLIGTLVQSGYKDP